MIPLRNQLTPPSRRSCSGRFRHQHSRIAAAPPAVRAHASFPSVTAADLFQPQHLPRWSFRLCVEIGCRSGTGPMGNSTVDPSSSASPFRSPDPPGARPQHRASMNAAGMAGGSGSDGLGGSGGSSARRVLPLRAAGTRPFPLPTVRRSPGRFAINIDRGGARGCCWRPRGGSVVPAVLSGVDGSLRSSEPLHRMVPGEVVSYCRTAGGRRRRPAGSCRSSAER